MSDELKAKVRRFYTEAYGEGNLDVVAELVAPDCQLHDPAMPSLGHGAEATINMITEYRKSFPDLKFTITDEVAEGDTVAVRWVARGTHIGDLKGNAATNKSFEIPGMVICRFRDGKISDAKVVWDALGLNMQLGLLSVAAAH